ncbi:HAD-IA family hydrolase [Saccharibacter sp. 17.LH.SD]|uniref:HAD family hydrolase n=1 Tax=Saccharibacter sp. 17.LH.SD TaxID=2689393 RepID=UPI00136867E9|nr:HAD family phosphatase [Saccharibacter sp. 17.LH.SD]MXV45155.1 HAD-IA family hydrolase [Saccharibacter sp. 17.LH.SD]
MPATELRNGLKLVIFDCDGVLIDSERPSCHATARFARSIGLEMSDQEALERFAGKALPQVARELSKLSGHPLPPDTADRLRQGLVDMMKKGASPVDGAPELLKALVAHHIPIRVGSNSSMAEMEAKFHRTGMDTYLPEDRIHSAVDMHHPKPDPEVYLYAARQEGVLPTEAVVVEDSDTGADAARRAGMSCILLRDDGHPLPPYWPVEGFVRVQHLSEVLPLIEAKVAPGVKK